MTSIGIPFGGSSGNSGIDAEGNVAPTVNLGEMYLQFGERIKNITHYGCDPLLADNGPALQALLDNMTQGGAIYVPGTSEDQPFSIQTPVKIELASRAPIHIYGDGPIRTGRLSTLAWTGTDPTQRMFEIIGANSMLAQGVNFAGTTACDALLHLHARTGDASQLSTWGQMIRDCHFGGLLNDQTSAYVMLGQTGTGGTSQLSEVSIDNCTFVGDGSGGSGVSVIEGGNTKDFAVSNCVINQCYKSLDFEKANGIVTLTNIQTQFPLFCGVHVSNEATLSIQGWHQENGGPAVLNTGANSRTTNINGLSWVSDGDATIPAVGRGGVAIAAAGNTVLNGGFLRTNAGDSAQIQLGGNPELTTPNNGRSNLVVQGTWFYGVAGRSFPPIIDGSGNNLTPDDPVTSFYGNKFVGVYCTGCTGGTTGSSGERFADFNGVQKAFRSDALPPTDFIPYTQIFIFDGGMRPAYLDPSAGASGEWKYYDGTTVAPLP